MPVIALDWIALVAGRQLPLVLGVSTISPRISPTKVNIRVYAAYRTGSNLVTRPSCVNLVNSIKCVGDSRSYLSYRRSHYALLILSIHLRLSKPEMCISSLHSRLSKHNISCLY